MNRLMHYLNHRAFRKYMDKHLFYRDDPPIRLMDADFEYGNYHISQEYKTACNYEDFALFDFFDQYRVHNEGEYYLLCMKREWNCMGIYQGSRTNILECCTPVVHNVQEYFKKFENGLYLTWYESAPITGDDPYPIRSFATLYLTPFLRERGILV